MDGVRGFFRQGPENLPGFTKGLFGFRQFVPVTKQVRQDTLAAAQLILVFRHLGVTGHQLRIQLMAAAVGLPGRIDLFYLRQRSGKVVMRAR